MDCAEPWALARFWAGLLGGTPVQWYPGWVTLEPPPHGQRLSFQASTAPPGAGAAKVHFDVLVGDLTAAHDRVIAAGAVFIRARSFAHEDEARRGIADAIDDVRARRGESAATAIAEIWTFTSRGRRATSTVARAGGALLKYVA